MKRNFFGAAVIQDGDDVGAIFSDEFDTNSDLTAQFLEKDDTFGWSCVVTDEELNELEVQGFTSEEDLRAFLHKHAVRIV